MTTQPAIPLTKAQRFALMNADKNGNLDCPTRVGNSLVRKGYARERLGFEITKAGRKRVAFGKCERSYLTTPRGCNGPGKLVEDPYMSDVENTPGVMVYLCDEHHSRLCDDI